jgi:hypothetical protein
LVQTKAMSARTKPVSTQPVDVLIGQTSGDDPGSRLAAAQDRFVGLDRDRDAIMRG